MATWTEDIVSALQRLGGSGTRDELLREIQSLRSILPSSWKQTVQREIQRQSSSSRGYQGGRDLFFSVDGLGRGVWGLRAAVEETPKGSDLEDVLPSGNRAPERAPQTTYRILRDTKLAREVKLLHRNECQICGEALQISGGTYAEAHHIIPLGREHNGPDAPGNVIVLCPNHHALCDMGAIRLDVATLNSVAGHVIDASSIDYHNGHIFRAV